MPGRRDNFVARRWRGEVPLRRLFWRDMLVVGSFANLLASFGALMVAAAGVPMAWAAVLHLAPLPYNLFLFVTLWRLPGRPLAMDVVAVAWLVLMTVL